MCFIIKHALIKKLANNYNCNTEPSVQAIYCFNENLKFKSIRKFSTKLFVRFKIVSVSFFIKLSINLHKSSFEIAFVEWIRLKQSAENMNYNLKN